MMKEEVELADSTGSNMAVSHFCCFPSETRLIIFRSVVPVFLFLLFELFSRFNFFLFFLFWSFF